MKYKYEAEGLKNCKDNALMMGEARVKYNAERQFEINQWEKLEKVVANATEG